MKDDKIPYLQEMLLNPVNINIGLGALALGAVASIPFGLSFGSIPLLAFLAGDVVASLYIPSSDKFKKEVDRKYRIKNRETIRINLLNEIKKKFDLVKNNNKYNHIYINYEKMNNVIKSLYDYANNSKTKLHRHEVEQLDDVTVEYLRLWLAKIVIEERGSSFEIDDIKKRVNVINNNLPLQKTDVDKRQLEKAKNEYTSMINRHNRMSIKIVAIDAAIISIPDQVNEVYQMIITTPVGEDISGKLNESLSKLILQEDIEIELDSFH